MIHRRRMMAAALAAIAIPCIAVGKHRRLQTVQCRRHEPRRNHRDPGGPITGAGRAVTGDGMVSAGFGSGRNGDCSSSSASAPKSESALTGTTFATTGAGRSDCSCSMGTCLANCFGSS